MTRLSIRARLTLAYAALLGIVLIAFTFITLEAMRISALSAADDELRSRVRETQSLWFHGRGLSARTRTELDGHTGDVFRIEQHGRLLYQSKTPFDETTMRAITAPLAAGGVTIRLAIPLRPYEETMARFRVAILSAVPIALLIAAGGGYWLSGRALRPVDRITREARAITPDNLGQRVAVPETRDELRLLAETINAMLDRIESAFQRLVQFTADASHELRSPVALMRTTAEVALRRPREEAGYREALAQVLAESERVSLMIADLLLLARSDAGSDTIEKAPLDLAVPLRAAIAQIERSVRQEIDGVTVSGNAVALQQLFTILLDNAVKYSTDAIDVSLRARDCKAVIEVRDHGIGIAPDDLPHVFERFYRADKARSRGGAGLGLAIARRIAEIHGGTIDVASEPGAGSTFTVTLPLFQEPFSRGA